MEKKYSTEERRSMILKMLHDEQKVLIADLVKTFGVSEVSIRKDLAVLEERQLLVRVKGGAIIMHKTEDYDDLSAMARFSKMEIPFNGRIIEGKNVISGEEIDKFSDYTEKNDFPLVFHQLSILESTKLSTWEECTPTPPTLYLSPAVMKI